MKTNLLIIAIVATLVTACTTGTQMTRTYDDDIYFSPKDVPPVSAVQDDHSGTKNKPEVVSQRIVVSEEQQNADGTKTLNNHIYQRDKKADYQSYDMDDQDLAESDTTIYYNDNDSVKYVINNYYEDNDIDFAYRINRFHRPYFYDPFFYDDFAFGYYPFYSGYYGGYDPYFSYGWGWGYPYSSYYSPFAWGFGGYMGYGLYNSWYNGYYDGYYSGYYGNGGYWSHQNPENVRYGRSSDLSNYRNNRSGAGRVVSGNTSESRLPNGISTSNGNRRESVVSRSNTSGDINNKNATIVNNRRQGNISSGTQVSRQSTTTSGNVRRAYQPSSTGRTYDQSGAVRQSQNYTPSYNKPRIVNQSNYNNNTYSRSRTSSSGNYDRGVVKSGSIQGQSYSAPRSSSSLRQSYQSRSSYSTGSSSSTGSYRSSGSSNGGSSRSYSPQSSGSTPSSGSYNSGSSGYSGGGGSYSGGSSGSSSGGSGGRSGSGGRR
jgi:hypothetical protein